MYDAIYHGKLSEVMVSTLKNVKLFLRSDMVLKRHS